MTNPIQTLISRPALHMKNVLMPGEEQKLKFVQPFSISTLEHAAKNNRKFLWVPSKDTNDKPLAGTGTLVRISEFKRNEDGSLTVTLKGERTARFQSLGKRGDHFVADTQNSPSFNLAPGDIGQEAALAFNANLIKMYETHAATHDKKLAKHTKKLKEILSPQHLVGEIARILNVSLEDKIKLLEAKNLGELKKHIEPIVTDFGKKKTDAANEITTMQQAVKDKKGLTKEAEEELLREITRLETLPASSEASVVRTYINYVLSLPWGEKSALNTDLKKAREILDQHHYGMEEEKKTVIEFLAIQQLRGTSHGTIKCLVGPPGVGKSSLAKAIAAATGRKYVRLSLGGVKDDAELRGHRRTYVGARAGSIIDGIRKSGTSNPVFLLDEVDKISNQRGGDPSAVLLEVLDRDQNQTYRDHYLDLSYDLSEVFFIATANELSLIPEPVRDRMEISFLGTYTEAEKLQIASLHLVSKQIEENGLKPEQFSISHEALRDLIRYYTREAGVRELERQIGKLCRKAAVTVVENGPNTKTEITTGNLPDEQYAGPRQHRYGSIKENDGVGVVTGLAFTSVGGKTLSLEVLSWPNSKGGKLSITGQAQDVMQESIQLALSLLKSKAQGAGLDLEEILHSDFHVHIPAGATPKDGPSAGAGFYTALFSRVSGTVVDRFTAMTGEIDGEGNVLGIGGLKEKLTAAANDGYTKVIIPQQNEKDLVKVPQEVRERLNIVCVSTVEEVLNEALVGGWKNPALQDHDENLMEADNVHVLEPHAPPPALPAEPASPA